jgi:hypothetical protein
MRYSAPHNAFILTQEELQRAATNLRYAIHGIRKLAGRPTVRSKHEGPVDTYYMAELGVLDAAKELGIDLGASRPGLLDVSDLDK